ncbi:ankyrin repeat-containing domain protein [Aspergillus californicus]
MHPYLSQKALILSQYSTVRPTSNHFHTFAYLPQRPLSLTLHINESYNMPTYTDILSEMSIAEPMAADVPVLMQRFQHALYQHNVKHEGSTILCRAAGQGRVSLMETLLNICHADVNAVHEDNTPLINAVMSGSLAAVELALSRSELDLIHFNQGIKALWYSTGQKDPAVAQRLLHQPGIDINTPWRAKSGKLLTTFNEAVIRNNTEVVKVFLAHGRADPNIAAENIQTPLLCASARGRVEIVRVLLGDSRVDRVRQDDRGCSALHCAAENGDVHIVDLLLADGRIDVNARDGTGSTALHRAAKGGYGRQWMLPSLPMRTK